MPSSLVCLISGDDDGDGDADGGADGGRGGGGGGRGDCGDDNDGDDDGDGDDDFFFFCSAPDSPSEAGICSTAPCAAHKHAANWRNALLRKQTHEAPIQQTAKFVSSGG